MYTRNVSLKLKANPFSASEFADILDRDIIPLLRKQKGPITRNYETSEVILSRPPTEPMDRHRYAGRTLEKI